VGAAFSNLVGETIAEHHGYTNAFLFLSLASLIPLFVYGLFMPSARHLSDGTAVDELSISQRSKYSQEGSRHSNHSHMRKELEEGTVTIDALSTKTEMVSNPIATKAE
jgi:hypothetical protein